MAYENDWKVEINIKGSDMDIMKFKEALNKDREIQKSNIEINGWTSMDPQPSPKPIGKLEIKFECKVTDKVYTNLMDLLKEANPQPSP